MAVWGTKTFEEDTAFDWISELVDSDDGRQFLMTSLELEKDDELIVADSGSVVLAASEVVLALLDEPRSGLPEEVTDWLDDNECDDVSDLPSSCVQSIAQVLSEGSELLEIWQDAEDYDEWRKGVDELSQALEALAESE